MSKNVAVVPRSNRSRQSLKKNPNKNWIKITELKLIIPNFYLSL